MKIAIFEPKLLTPRPNAGSHLIVAMNQARSLARQGHEVVVLAEKDNSEVFGSEPNLTVHPLTGAFTPLTRRFSASRVRIPTYSHLFSPDILVGAVRWLKSQAPDVLYGCGTSFMAVPTAMLGRLAGVPSAHYVLQFAGPWKWWRPYQDVFGELKVPRRYIFPEVMKNSLYQPLRLEAIHRWGLRHVDIVIACSQYLRRNLERYRACGGDEPVIYPGVDIPDLPAAPPHVEYQDVTYMGHLWQGRGVLDLVRAFAVVAKKMPRSRLVVAATNADTLTEQYFNALVIEHKLQGRVLRLGIVQDPLRELVAPAAVMVFPYRDKPSMKLLECMAAEKTIVTTDIDWIPEIIRNRDNGLLAKPGDVDGLAQQILAALADRGFAEALGQKARLTSSSLCDINKNTSQLARVLAIAAGRKGIGKHQSV